MKKIKTNFPGLVTQLAQHLYPEPDLFIRELLQNAHDAIQLRRVREPFHCGRVHVTTHPESRSIAFSDNGDGMSRSMIEEKFATAGSSGTAEMAMVAQEQGKANFATIGRFGIGLLSAFAVAERVDVFTRYMESGKSWHWSSRGDGEYFLQEASEPCTGTRVVVTLKPMHAWILDETAVDRAIRRHADFLRVPIFLDKRGPVNAMRFPWETPAALSLAQWKNNIVPFIERHYREVPLFIIRVNIPKLQTHGFLFMADPNAAQTQPISLVDLYQNRMLLRSGVPDLLPEQAWMRGVLESRILQPNASRDDAIRNESWCAFQRALGEAVADAFRSKKQECPGFLQGHAGGTWHHRRLSPQNEAHPASRFRL